MKRLVYVLIALIPLAVTWVIVVSYDPNYIARETPASAPKWIEESTYSTCSAAITGKPVTNQTVAIDKAHAARIGAGVVASQTNLLTLPGRVNVDFIPYWSSVSSRITNGIWHGLTAKAT